MKRELKFRGKSNVDGEWYFGSYVKTNDDTNNPFKTTAPKEYHNIVYYAAPDFLLGGWNNEPVIPQTVGQFTGLLDKNGKEIYEGDIVHLDSWKPNAMQIKFIEAAFCLADENGEYLGDIHYIQHAQVNQCTVLGNIHDTPELLKTETL